MGKTQYKVEFLKEQVTRRTQHFWADMVQIDPCHTKFYENGILDNGRAHMVLVASFPTHIIEAVTKVGK